MLSMTYLVISHEVHIRYAEPFPEIHASTNSAFLDGGPCQVGLVFRLFASHTVGRGFAPLPGHTKDHHKMVQTASLHRHACVRVRVWQCSSTV